MDELDRDLHAIWRWLRFLRRRDLLSWDADQAADLVGAYARDKVVQASIASTPYQDIEGLAPRHHPPRTRLRAKNRLARSIP